MKYKVGDTVTIRKDLSKVDLSYIDILVDEAMLKYEGKTAKIIDVEEGYYILNIDTEWIWGDEMLEEEIIQRNTIEVKSIPNILSYTLDTQYSCYIKSQNVSSEEKIAVKKFIEFVRKNMSDRVDKDTNNIKIK